MAFIKLLVLLILLASPNISSKNRINHNFLQAEIQRQSQALVVHVNVISALIFLRTKSVKQGNISGLTD